MPCLGLWLKPSSPLLSTRLQMNRPLSNLSSFSGPSSGSHSYVGPCSLLEFARFVLLQGCCTADPAAWNSLPRDFGLPAYPRWRIGFGSNVCTLPVSVKVTLPTWHLLSHDLSFFRDTQPCVITLLVSLFIVYLVCYLPSPM